VSRAIKVITPLVAKACESEVPTAEDLDERVQYIVDGTLLPCWSWASHPELHSGKHKTTGLNVQVACTLAGDLVRIWLNRLLDKLPEWEFAGDIEFSNNFTLRGLQGMPIKAA